jgi:hypothetical protein
LAYQPPASSTFLSQQTSHQQPTSSTLLSEQTSTNHQPPTNRTGCLIQNNQYLQKKYKRCITEVRIGQNKNKYFISKKNCMME